MHTLGFALSPGLFIGGGIDLLENKLLCFEDWTHDY